MRSHLTREAYFERECLKARTLRIFNGVWLRYVFLHRSMFSGSLKVKFCASGLCICVYIYRSLACVLKTAYMRHTETVEHNTRQWHYINFIMRTLYVRCAYVNMVILCLCITFSIISLFFSGTFDVTPDPLSLFLFLFLTLPFCLMHVFADLESFRGLFIHRSIMTRTKARPQIQLMFSISKIQKTEHFHCLP